MIDMLKRKNKFLKKKIIGYQYHFQKEGINDSISNSV